MPEFLRRQAHGGNTNTAGACQNGKNADGGDELQQTQSGGTDAFCQKDVKADGDQPKQEVGGGQQQCPA